MELQVAVSKKVLGKVCMKQLKEMRVEGIQGQVTGGPYIMSRNLGFISLNKELRKVTMS